MGASLRETGSTSLRSPEPASGLVPAGNDPARGIKWSDDEVSFLRKSIAEGVSFVRIGKALQRSDHAVRMKAGRLGLRLSAEAVERNRKAGTAAYRRDPHREAIRAAKFSAGFTSERRAAAGDRLRRLHAENPNRPHTPASRRKLAAATRNHFDRKVLPWLPRVHPLRAEYRKLVKSMGSAEARRIIRAEIERERARMSPFERQMEAVRNGRGIIVTGPRTAQIGEMPHRESRHSPNGRDGEDGSGRSPSGAVREADSPECSAPIQNNIQSQKDA